MSPEREDHTPELPRDVHPEEPAQRESVGFNKWWVGGWLSPLLVAGGTLAWCLLIYFLIGDRVRDWQYGTVPYVPGESLTAIEPAPRRVPNQVTLPERTTEGQNAEP